MDLWNMVAGLVTHGDPVTWAIMAIVAIGAGFVMQDMSGLVTATIGALIVYAIALYVKTLATTSGADPMAVADKNWHAFLLWPVQGLIAYAILFAIAIAIVGIVRSIVMR